MLAGLREYDAQFNAVASPAAAFDFWEINGHASRITWVTGIEIGQSTEIGDAMEEFLVITWIQAHSTSGNGTAVTPNPNNTDAAFGGTVERMATTQATGGSPVTRRATTFNVRAGYCMIWDPTKWLMVPVSGRLVLACSAPADAITFSSTVYLAEAG
jgi:hypothetical protein